MKLTSEMTLGDLFIRLIILTYNYKRRVQSHIQNTYRVGTIQHAESKYK